ncbi:ParB family protein [Paracidovorax wautersii]|uniref:ParB family protein n=2 Tax=Paracidovorax wautersii TaxID=1177982 RepID=A0A1I2H2B7_9BURK|nr:ParB family protein [Paracidovorax wautersii]
MEQTASPQPTAPSSTSPTSHPTRMVLYLDPHAVIIAPTPNRSEISYNTPRFHALLSSIQASRGNIVPIEVRLIPGTPDRHVLISGERRLRACRLAQVPVLAIIASEGSAADDSLNRLRENTGRQDLTPWESAQQVKALQAQLQPIKNYEIAALLGVSASMVSRSLDLCSLPGDVIQAFTSPSDIQYAYVPKLKAALAKDADAVLLEAAAIQEETPRPTARRVVERIEEAVEAARHGRMRSEEAPPAATAQKSEPSTSPEAFPLEWNGQPLGHWQRDAQGKLDLHIDSRMTDALQALLMESVVQFLADNVLKAHTTSRTARAARTTQSTKDLRPSAPAAAIPAAQPTAPPEDAAV